MSQLQINLFNYIKSVIPSNLSFVDEIAEVLEISNDSAYRRIRGEKQISFEEIQKLSARFKIPIDQVLNLQNNSIVFSGNLIEAQSFDFMEYLDEFVYKNLVYITSFKQREFFYFSKDIPDFYYFMFPELAAFKFFFWMKTVLHFPSYNYRKFSVKEIEPQFFERVKKIAAISCQIPSREILNVENFQITLRQIEYYKDTGFFTSKTELELLYDKLHEMVNHMEKLCETGKKYMPGQKPLQSDGFLKIYVNDFIIGDNSFIVIVNEKKMCFVNHNTVNFMLTHDEKFCNYSHDSVQNIMRKSNLISEAGERERSMFFNQARQRIELYRRNEIKTLSKMPPYY
ncbi:MAG TPA: hypothetical protein VN958_08890 [Chitinophagaceae bacterium]|nr:hypothetical protein [Chitinophagaceae bacterium]